MTKIIEHELLKMRTTNQRLDTIEQHLSKQDLRVREIESDLQVAKQTDDTVLALRELTTVLRKDTDKNTAAIESLTSTIGGLIGAIKQAGWAIGGGISVGGSILFGIYWLYSHGFVTVAMP